MESISNTIIKQMHACDELLGSKFKLQLIFKINK